MAILHIRSKGTIARPASLRKKYKLKEGGTLTIIDLGDGIILPKPMTPQVDKLANRIAKKRGHSSHGGIPVQLCKNSVQ